MVTVRASLASRLIADSMEMTLSSEPQSSLVTMISADTAKIETGLRKLHEGWANLLGTIVGLVLLEREFKLVVLAVLGLALTCVLASLVTSAFAGHHQKSWMSSIGQRLAKTSETLRLIRGIKLTNSELRISAILLHARNEEIQYSQRYRYFLIWTVSLGLLIPSIFVLRWTCD